MTRLKTLVEQGYASAEPAQKLSSEIQNAVDETYDLLNRGQLRVVVNEAGEWKTQAWVKQAILLYFRMHNVTLIDNEPLSWVDKIPVKKWTVDMGVRVVPPAVVRYGAFVAKGCVLMPSYVNVGAYVDEGTMVDTWATVGSCAQIGKNVHLSGGVGIGGVLEPPQALPVIVEDGAFVGSRCIVVEGVRIGSEAVLGAGVVLTASTPIIDVRGSEPVLTKGFVPPRAVVIPGSQPKRFSAGEFGTPCALIIGERDEDTDRKTSLNAALREYEVAV